MVLVWVLVLLVLFLRLVVGDSEVDFRFLAGEAGEDEDEDGGFSWDMVKNALYYFGWYCTSGK